MKEQTVECGVEKPSNRKSDSSPSKIDVPIFSLNTTYIAIFNIKFAFLLPRWVGRLEVWKLGR